MCIRLYMNMWAVSLKCLMNDIADEASFVSYMQAGMEKKYTHNTEKVHLADFEWRYTYPFVRYYRIIDITHTRTLTLYSTGANTQICAYFSIGTAALMMAMMMLLMMVLHRQIQHTTQPHNCVSNLLYRTYHQRLTRIQRFWQGVIWAYRRQHSTCMCFVRCPNESMSECECVYVACTIPWFSILYIIIL